MNGENPYETSEVMRSDVKSTNKFVTFLKWAILSVLGLIVLVGSCSFMMFKGYQEQDQFMRPYAQEVFADLITWEYGKIEKHLSDELKDEVPEEDFLKITKSYSKLGSLIGAGEPQQENCSSFSGTNGSYTRCNYSIQAEFEAGEALVSLGVITENEGYKIIQININSDAFL